jgi:hypothetical protein
MLCAYILGWLLRQYFRFDVAFYCLHNHAQGRRKALRLYTAHGP